MRVCFPSDLFSFSGKFMCEGIEQKEGRGMEAGSLGELVSSDSKFHEGRERGKKTPCIMDIHTTLHTHTITHTHTHTHTHTCARTRARA